MHSYRLVLACVLAFTLVGCNDEEEESEPIPVQRLDGPSDSHPIPWTHFQPGSSQLPATADAAPPDSSEAEPSSSAAPDAPDEEESAETYPPYEPEPDGGDHEPKLCVGGRTPGFWCQNQDGHPEMSAEEFAANAAEAAALLGAVPALDTAGEIAAAVCDESNQLLRHLAALALNLAADFLGGDTPLVKEDYATVGEVLAEAIAVATGQSSTDPEDIKDVLDRINNDQNTVLGFECGGCPPDPY